MIVKTKKRVGAGVARLETRGEIKEVLLNENMVMPNAGGVQICFRGVDGAGIVELTEEEARDLFKTLGAKMGLSGNVRLSRENF